MAGKTKASFEENMNRLSEIVRKLELGDATLSESTSLFAEAAKLIKSCTDELDKAEQQVVQLKRTPDGGCEELPFDD